MNSTIILALALIISKASGMSITNGPCFMNDFDRPTEQNQMGIPSLLQPVMEQILDLKLNTEDLLEKMKIYYCVDEEELKDASFLNVKMNIFNDKRMFLHNYNGNNTSFLMSIREHYDMLNLLANYLQTLRGIINERTAQDSMFLVQKRIYNVMCTIKIVLRSKNKDPQASVPGGKVSDTLFGYRQQTPNRCHEQELEYVTIHDCNRVARYLELLYTYILKSDN